MEKFLKSWINFDEMITPQIIKIIYWLLMLSTIIGGIATMFNQFLLGFIGLIVGIIGVRVGCELVILSFNIYKCVKKIADSKDNPNS